MNMLTMKHNSIDNMLISLHNEGSQGWIVHAQFPASIYMIDVSVDTLDDAYNVALAIASSVCHDSFNKLIES